MSLIRTLLLGDARESLPKPVVAAIGFAIVMAFAVELAIGFGGASLANVELLRSIGRSDPALARHDLERALAILPRRHASTGTAALLGKAFERQGDDVTAANVWEAGLALAPRDDRMRYWLGSVDHRLGLWGQAVAVWQRDGDVARTVGEHFADLGDAALASDQPYESERLLLRAAEVDPTNDRPFYTLSELYRREPFIQQGPGQAIAMARLAAAVDPTESVEKHNALGMASYLENDCAAASEEFQAALSIVPDDVGSLHFLGVCKLALGDVQDGVDLLEELVSVVPTHYWSYVHLARVAEERGQTELAACYRRAAEQVAGVGDVGAAVAYERGYAPKPCR